MSSLQVPDEIAHLPAHWAIQNQGYWDIDEVQEGVLFEGDVCTRVVYRKDFTYCCPPICRPCEKVTRLGVGLLGCFICCCGVGISLCCSEKCEETFMEKYFTACAKESKTKTVYWSSQKKTEDFYKKLREIVAPSVCAPQHQSMEVPAPPPSTPLLRNARIVAS